MHERENERRSIQWTPNRAMQLEYAEALATRRSRQRAHDKAWCSPTRMVTSLSEATLRTGPPDGAGRRLAKASVSMGPRTDVTTSSTITEFSTGSPISRSPAAFVVL